MSENFEVDTEQIRSVAAKLKTIAGKVQNLAEENVRQMHRTVEENLKGQTADVMKTRLDELSSDIGRIASGLQSVQKALNTYAKQIEAADTELAKFIKG